MRADFGGASHPNLHANGSERWQTRGVTNDGDRLDARRAGDVIVLADVVGTLAFSVTAITAAVVFSTPAQWVGAITAMAREEQIGVMQMYLLLGEPTPARVRRIMLSMLAIQSIVALVTALARSESEDGSPGTSLAVGILVPMFGLGLNGLWCAFHGVFPPREDLGLHDDDTDVVTSRAAIDKNGDHG